MPALAASYDHSSPPPPDPHNFALFNHETLQSTPASTYLTTTAAMSRHVRRFFSLSAGTLANRRLQPDFKTLEASRPAFAAPKEQPFTYTQTPKPSWVPGTGATSEEWKKHKSVVIDPHAEDRVPVDNYKLLISGIVPRPVGLSR